MDTGGIIVLIVVVVILFIAGYLMWRRLHPPETLEERLSRYEREYPVVSNLEESDQYQSAHKPGRSQASPPPAPGASPPPPVPLPPLQTSADSRDLGRGESEEQKKRESESGNAPVLPVPAASSPPPPPPQAVPAPVGSLFERKEETPEEATESEADEAEIDDILLARGGQAEEAPEPQSKPIPAAPVPVFGGALPDVDVEKVVERATEVELSAYYPKEVVPETWEKLHAYIYRRLAAGAVEEDAGKQLGERKPDFRGVRTPAKVDVPEGAMVTAAPQLEGFQFNPPSVSLGFYKDWHRFDFEVRAKGAPLNQSTNGLLTFSVEGIIVADIPLSIYVGESVSAGDNRVSTVATLYQAIFCSYSHRDTQIVTRAERAYKALGLDYLRDVISLKSGQEWDEELLNLISRADIFQLFWSSAAAESDYVRQEWQHALKLSEGKSNFIRPVYWEEPKPSIPAELGHIHFAYQPDLDD